MPKKPFSIVTKIKSFFDDISATGLVGTEHSKRRHELVDSFKARSDRNRTLAERIADQIAGVFGSVEFIGLHVVWFAGWIAWNTGLVPDVLPFDPYPFGLLTMIVSLEAIFLSSFVLLSQSRSAKVADLREDVDLNINVQTELEVTKVLNLVDEIHQHLGLKTTHDRELEQLKQRTDVAKIEETIVTQTEAAAHSPEDPREQ
jgi:uncharacterized membrane protein